MPVLRDAFLKLSTNRAAHKAVVGFPLSRKITRRFVAGETLEDAMAVIQRVNGEGLLATVDHLGESVTNAEEARRAKDDYLRALNAIQQHQLQSHVSVKLTHMGLDIDPELCLANMREIVSKAKQIDTKVRIDMEDSTRTQITLNIFKTLREEFENIGVVIQAYLYRSEADMRELYNMGARVRLCKGAYKEPPDVAFPLKKDTDANFLKLAQIFLGANGNYTGAHLALATHDVKIIDWAKQYIREHQVPYDRFEFQMLYGIRSDLQHQLVREGYPMRVYIPYGSQWYPYFMRRLAERPANVIFLVSNLFK
ncbi:MAG TPA: proline dehydrogenase family protein [Anaerolineae bacterium]|nr:proline dehydrogenase family protein [Anaerolineae bacterium]